MLTIMLMLALIVVAGWFDSRLNWLGADRPDQEERS